MTSYRSLAGNSTAQYRSGGSIAGRYLIVRVLGRGGLGTVLLVRDSQLANQEVALKIPHRHVLADDRAGLRLRNELLLHRQLAHPGIVKIFHAGELSENIPYFTMEYVPGCSLRELLQVFPDGRMPTAEVEFLARNILESLAFAHSKGIVHRDLKPDNVLVSRDGSVKVSDFGLAQTASEGHDFTRTGESVGTPSYMSPEQFATGVATERSDLYSVGILVFELLTGALPFSASTYLGLANAHLTAEPPWHMLRDIDAPNHFVEFLRRCIAKDPADRFESARAAQQFFESAFTEPPPRSELVTRGSLVAAVRSRDRRTLRIHSGMTIARMVFIAFCIIGYLNQIQSESRKQPIFRAVLQLRLALGLHSIPIEALFGLERVGRLGEFSVLEAASRSEFSRLQALALTGLPLDRTDSDGNTLLHLAADFGSRGGVFARLSAANVDLHNLRNLNGETALLRGVLARNLQFVRGMLDHGASPNIPDKHGLTPLMAAVERQDSECVLLILRQSQYQVQAHRLSSDGHSVLSRAVANRDVASVEALLENGIDPDLRDRTGRTPLMVLVTAPVDSINSQIAKLLVETGVDWEVLDNDGRSLNDWATAEWSRELSALRVLSE